MEGGGINSPAPPPWTIYPCFWSWAKGGVGKIFHPEKFKTALYQPKRAIYTLTVWKSHVLKMWNIFWTFPKRNVFTRDMRDFSVADQGKMDQTKCRKCPNSEWSFQFWVFNPGWQKNHSKQKATTNLKLGELNLRFSHREVLGRVSWMGRSLCQAQSQASLVRWSKTQNLNILLS